MIVIIDHRDSFTWNIVHMFEQHAPVSVVDYASLASTAIPYEALVVLSPGPGQPADYPETLAWYKNAPREQAIFGICLGFQMMLYAAGCSIVRQERVMHGVQSTLAVEADSVLYRGLSEPILVGRYHALKVECPDTPEGFRISARDAKNPIPLSIEHLTLRRFGVQYHPDSFLTPDGDRIIANLYRELGRRA